MAHDLGAAMAAAEVLVDARRTIASAGAEAGQAEELVRGTRAIVPSRQPLPRVASCQFFSPTLSC